MVTRKDIAAEKKQCNSHNCAQAVLHTYADVADQKIAIPTNEGMLWPHFGKAPQVTIVTVEDGQIKESVIKQSPEHEHGAMPRFLAAEGCTDVVCGGLGQGAVQMLAQLGIEVHAGAPVLPVEQVLAMYLDDTIEYGDGTCHHDGCGGHHHHHE